MHPTPPVTTLPRELRPYLELLNQVFEIDKKASALTESNSIQRNVRNMRSWFEREIVAGQGGQQVVFSLTFHNPIGEAYNETRADCDASIAGSGTEQLVITEVMKPIVWLSVGGASKHIVQQAVVVVESSQSPPTQQQKPLDVAGESTGSVIMGNTYSFDNQSSAKVEPSTASSEGGHSTPAEEPSASEETGSPLTQSPS